MTSNVTSAVKCEEDLFCGVNVVKDIDNMTDLEKKHFPVITAPKSVREGEIPGTHTVNFESKADIIKLEHEAKGREGFASGAVMAAEWIKDKKGFYSIEDMMKDVIK